MAYVPISTDDPVPEPALAHDKLKHDTQQRQTILFTKQKLSFAEKIMKKELLQN
jgi:hypothetical protein